MKTMKSPVTLRRHHSLLLNIPIALCLLVISVSVAGRQARVFRLISGYRGTSALSTTTEAPTTCAIRCHRKPACEAFNHFPATNRCDTVSYSLGYTTDATSDMYIAKKTYIGTSAIDSCTSCGDNSWPAMAEDWDINCNLGQSGYITGISSLDVNLTTIDRLLCNYLTTLRLDMTYGVALPNSGDCITTMGKHALVTAIWIHNGTVASDQPFAALCREIKSQHKIDVTNCKVPDVVYENVTYYQLFQVTYHSYCPGHAVVGAYYLPDQDLYTLKCCKIIENPTRYYAP